MDLGGEVLRVEIVMVSVIKIKSVLPVGEVHLKVVAEVAVRSSAG